MSKDINTGDCNTRVQDFIENTHELNCINRVIAVISGKGGVGKSLITSMLAVKMRRKGYRIGILDADITGPSIPKMFGISKKAKSSSIGIYPQKTKNDINIMSINLLIDKVDSPVIWRGPIISGVVKQFWKDVIWSDIDYLFIDMPPGTGDVPLTVYQSIPLDGIIVVTSPQDLVSLIVKKAYNMAKTMNIPIIGIVENMSYLKCPECNKEINIFGKSNVENTSSELGLKVLGKVPIDITVAELCDIGKIETVNNNYLDNAVDYIEKILEPDLKFKEENKLDNELEGEFNMKIAVASEGKNVTEHFGHCEGFNVFTVEGNKIVNNEFIINPGHQPGFLPNYLNDIGINVIISGGMGGGAIEIFNEKGIHVVVGAAGIAEEAAKKYIEGSLKSTNSVCNKHEHHDSCGE